MARPLVLLLAYLTAAILLYGPALSGGPVWDDHLLLGQNAVIRGEVPALEAFSSPFEPFDLFYRPVTALVLRWTTSTDAVGGPGVRGGRLGQAAGDVAGAANRPATGGLLTSHVVAALLHAVVAWSVAGILRQFGLRRLAATLAGFLFLVHPALSEAVAWMSGLGDLLAAAGMALASWLFLGLDPRAGGRERVVRAGAGLVSIGVAVFAKETAFLLPIWLLAWTRFPGRRSAKETVRPGWIVTSLLLLVLFGFIALRAHALRHAAEALLPVDPARSLVLLGTYVRLLVWPVGLDLAPVVPMPQDLDARAILGALTLGGVVFGLYRSGRRRSPALFGLVWAVAAGAPVLFLVPASSPLLAERYLYLPSVGLAIAIAAGAHELSRSLAARWVRTAIAGIAVAALAASALTWARAGDWSSEPRILDRSLARDPRNVAVAVNRGFLLRTEGAERDARTLYARTIDAVEDGGPIYWTEHGRVAWDRLVFEAATLALRAGDLAEGERLLRRGLETRPDDERLLASLGAVLGTTGRYEEAVTTLAAAVTQHPQSLLLRANLAEALIRLGRTPEARAQYDEILRLDPGNAGARTRLAELDATLRNR